MPCALPSLRTHNHCLQAGITPSLTSVQGRGEGLRQEESQAQSQEGCLGSDQEEGHCCPLCRSRWNKEPSFWLRRVGESSSATLPACITSTRSESKMVFSLWTANIRTHVGGSEEKPWILLPLLSRGGPRHAQHQDLWSISLCTQGHTAVQLSREPLQTAETHHLLREHSDACQLLGMAEHQERRGKLCGGRAQGMPDSGVAQDVSIPTEELLSCFCLPLHFLTYHLLRAAEMGLCISCHSPAVWHLYLRCHYQWICSCQTANHSMGSTRMHPVLPRLLAGQQPLALGREDRAAGMPLYSCALFSAKLQPDKAASHKEDAAQNLSR